jgi:uncharacterized lipoprotein YmbA
MTNQKWVPRMLGKGQALLAVVALAACASPPVILYTLVQSAVVGPETVLGRKATVIEVERVSLPDYLDTQDILIRRGSALNASQRGRWASRLSLGATDLLTARLAQSRPNALVTDQPQIGTQAYRILINVSRLDIAADIGALQGSAVLEADWTIVSSDVAIPIVHGRVRLEADGPIQTDRDVVALEGRALSQLAAAIDITRL